MIYMIWFKDGWNTNFNRKWQISSLGPPNSTTHKTPDNHMWGRNVFTAAEVIHCANRNLSNSINWTWTYHSVRLVCELKIMISELPVSKLCINDLILYPLYHCLLQFVGFSRIIILSFYKGNNNTYLFWFEVKMCMHHIKRGWLLGCGFLRLYPTLSTTCTLIAALCWSVTTVKMMEPQLKQFYLMNNSSHFPVGHLRDGIYSIAQNDPREYRVRAGKRKSARTFAP